VKSLSQVLLAVYSALLAWLILFKFSVHIASALHYDNRSLNLVPSSSSSGSSTEIAANIVVFIPFGLLLALNFKQLGLRRLLLVVFALSLAAEIVQYIFAIGAADITDVITNTVGGLIG
jgi:glycopeptide antibiotics resistance protein